MQGDGEGAYVLQYVTEPSTQQMSCAAQTLWAISA